MKRWSHIELFLLCGAFALIAFVIGGVAGFGIGRESYKATTIVQARAKAEREKQAAKRAHEEDEIKRLEKLIERAKLAKSFPVEVKYLRSARRNLGIYRFEYELKNTSTTNLTGFEGWGSFVNSRKEVGPEMQIKLKEVLRAGETRIIRMDYSTVYEEEQIIRASKPGELKFKFAGTEATFEGGPQIKYPEL